MIGNYNWNSFFISQSTADGKLFNVAVGCNGCIVFSIPTKYFPVCTKMPFMSISRAPAISSFAS